MAAGDRLIDADGNVLVNSDGNGVVKDANNECPECCGSGECWHRWESEWDCSTDTFTNPVLVETGCLSSAPTPTSWTQKDDDCCKLQIWIQEDDANNDPVTCADSTDCEISPTAPDKPTGGIPDGCCCNCATNELIHTATTIDFKFERIRCQYGSTDCGASQFNETHTIWEGRLSRSGCGFRWDGDLDKRGEDSNTALGCPSDLTSPFTFSSSVRFNCDTQIWELKRPSPVGWVDIQGVTDDTCTNGVADQGFTPLVGCDINGEREECCLISAGSDNSTYYYHKVTISKVN